MSAMIKSKGLKTSLGLIVKEKFPEKFISQFN
jgi:hypothetical protein